MKGDVKQFHELRHQWFEQARKLIAQLQGKPLPEIESESGERPLCNLFEHVSSPNQNGTM